MERPGAWTKWRGGVFFAGVFTLAQFLLVSAVCAQPAPQDESTKPKTADLPAKNGAKGGNIREIIAGPGRGGIPVFIKSESLSLDTKERVFTYKGKVEIVRGDVTITADRVVGKYDDKNELQQVVAEDNVVLTRGEEMRASANRAVYAIAQAKIELTEGPELARKGNVLSADKITVYVDEDRSEAEGNVRVKVIQTEGTGSLPGKDKLLKTEEEKAAQSGAL